MLDKQFEHTIDYIKVWFDATSMSFQTPPNPGAE